jgi:hypothetical protein
MGPLAQKLRQYKSRYCRIPASIAHDSTQGISVGISDFQTTLPVCAQALTSAKHSAQQKLVELIQPANGSASLGVVFFVFPQWNNGSQSSGSD